MSRAILGSAVAVALLVAPAAARADAPGTSAPCRWEAKAYVAVRDGHRLPHLGAVPVYAGPAPAVAATPAPYVWNPVFPVDAKGRVHGRSDGKVSSILTVSGGGCTETHVAVLVYSDGFVPNRGLALDYGPLTSLAAHAESEAPLRLEKFLLSADARTLGRPRDDSLELRSGYAYVRGGPTLEIAYLATANDGLRASARGPGVALEIPPALDQALSADGSLSYYPSLVGGGGDYRALRYRLTGTVSLSEILGSPYYFELSILGDHRSNVGRGPAAQSYQAVTLGAGYRFGGAIP